MPRISIGFQMLIVVLIGIADLLGYPLFGNAINGFYAITAMLVYDLCSSLMPRNKLFSKSKPVNRKHNKGKK